MNLNLFIKKGAFINKRVRGNVSPLPQPARNNWLSSLIFISGTTMKFKPTYLYIKIHNKSGLKYFGKTVRAKYHTYSGSGTYWRNHLKKHGNDCRTIIYGYYEDEELCNKDAMEFSKSNNIIESSEWANKIFETGLQGYYCHDMAPAKIAKTNENIGMVLKNDPRWKTGEIVSVLKGKKKSKESSIKCSIRYKGTAPAKNKNGEMIGNVSLLDPRWKTGEIVSINSRRKWSKETIEKRAKSRIGLKQSKETIEKRVNSRKGYKHSQEIKDKIAEKLKGVATIHSQETKDKIAEKRKGKIWITNGDITKSINKEDVIPFGFRRGMK